MSWWIEASLCLLPCEPFHMAAHNMAADFIKQAKERARESANKTEVFCNLLQTKKQNPITFSIYQKQVTRSNPHLRAGITQDTHIRRWVIGGHLRGCLPTVSIRRFYLLHRISSGLCFNLFCHEELTHHILQPHLIPLQNANYLSSFHS